MSKSTLRSRILLCLLLFSTIVACGSEGPKIAAKVTKAVTIDALFLPDAKLPPPSVGGAWGKESSDYDGGDSLFFEEKIYRIRHWRPSPKVNALIQIVREYDTAEAAEVERVLAPYGRIIVDNENGYGEVAPVNIDGLGLGEESAALACVGRGPNLMNKCPFWEFRKRYGPYIIDIAFSRYLGNDRNQELSRDAFLEVVYAIDRHVKEVIGG
jgi:hypothetical protein